MSEPLKPQEVARRLIRSRNWHLVQAARCRTRAVEEMRRLDDEAYRHQRVADQIADDLHGMGFDPQPPMGPRPTGDAA